MGNANARYYSQKNPFMDFTTAPEISQLFGEMLGLWCIVSWQALGHPSSLQIVELGPGRGTLMADILRIVRKVQPVLYKAVSVHLVETSPALQERQRAALSSYNDISVTWHAALQTVPSGPTLWIGNEFLDALPIRQFRLHRKENDIFLQERFITQGRFEWQNAEWPDTLNPLKSRLQKEEEAIVEICEAAQFCIKEISTRLGQESGTALLIDYGYTSSVTGETFQAIYQGQPSDPLQHEGKADLTAHVDFHVLKEIALQQECQVGLTTQGNFLNALGIGMRARLLMEQADDNTQKMILTALKRLTDAREMGTLFKVMVLTPRDIMGLPGFDNMYSFPAN